MATLGLLPVAALTVFHLLQSAPLPGATTATFGIAAVILDMAAVELRIYGYYSAAPACLGALALVQPGPSLFLIAVLGLLLRTLVLGGKGWPAACWEAGGRSLFLQTLLWVHHPLGIVPAAAVVELWERAGAMLFLEPGRPRVRWARLARLIRPHQLGTLALAPILSLLAQVDPLYPLLALPLLASLHRAVDSEHLQLKRIDDEELQREKEMAERQLSQVSHRLERTQEKLQQAGLKENVFWELGPVLFHCRSAAETARRSLDYLLSRVPCQQAAFLVARGASLEVLAIFPQDGCTFQSPHMAVQSWQQQQPWRAGPELALPLGHLGLLYCCRAQPFQDDEVQLLSHLSGLFALGLQSVTLLQEQQHVLAGLAQSSKVAAVGQLAAGMAHELNSPLAAVELQLGLIRQRLDRPEQLSASLDSAHRSLSRARELLQKLLFYSREGSHSRQQVALHKVAEDTVDFLRQTLAANGVEIECDLKPLAPVEGNANQLQQAISSLILNARDACTEGGRVTVSSRMQGALRQLRVIDNGHGIAPEIAERIFEPFFTTRAVGALGLGLAQAQQIAQQHGGRLTGRNRSDGPGAEFLLEL
jgi:signal transduction histidine kinase